MAWSPLRPPNWRPGAARASLVLHVLDAEHHRSRLASERRRVLRDRPNHRLQELAKGRRFGVGVELKLDDDKARVVHWSKYAMVAHTSVSPYIAEAVEGRHPSVEVGDRMLNVRLEA